MASEHTEKRQDRLFITALCTFIAISLIAGWLASNRLKEGYSGESERTSASEDLGTFTKEVTEFGNKYRQFRFIPLNEKVKVLKQGKALMNRPEFGKLSPSVKNNFRLMWRGWVLDINFHSVLSMMQLKYDRLPQLPLKEKKELLEHLINIQEKEHYRNLYESTPVALQEKIVNARRILEQSLSSQ